MRCAILSLVDTQRKIGVTELALRDAHQSLMATRMATEDMVGACADIDGGLIGGASLKSRDFVDIVKVFN